ncbi:hypothetical protein Ana3638_07610 [Anaerocolumna sedimenticola]|uniref:Uncharacterized protein n=1 Tax=Anaerocolumna sedimenticola TaxID=2696063 RepID=A0A6P1TKL8_9FIRM|nr:DUF6669 family protein [Anaerocolumna sedimenticola]QHQ60652.1 hypothetical protein Ana3638_07610 [Anaerocolumna sedimenticola]
MKEIQTLTGTLDRGFVGNITYNFNLESSYDKLYICLTYDNEKIETADSYYKHRIEEAYEKHYGFKPDDNQLQDVIGSMKTEIQLAAFINGSFVGNIHMPGTKKEMILSEKLSSDGCLPCKNMKGLLKIVINAFSVLENRTSYILQIKGEEQNV